LITIAKAGREHVAGIIDVCSRGWSETYKHLYPQEYIDRTIQEFYNEARITEEVLYTSRDWNGWFVAVEDEKVVGAIGGGMMTEDKGEIFVFYMDLNRRGEGIGRSIDCRTKSIWRVRTMGISRKRE
jgi:GNAT superfamily N-acetyltransferase